MGSKAGDGSHESHDEGSESFLESHDEIRDEHPLVGRLVVKTSRGCLQHCLAKIVEVSNDPPEIYSVRFLCTVPGAPKIHLHEDEFTLVDKPSFK